MTAPSVPTCYDRTDLRLHFMTHDVARDHLFLRAVRFGRYPCWV